MRHSTPKDHGTGRDRQGVVWVGKREQDHRLTGSGKVPYTLYDAVGIKMDWYRKRKTSGGSENTHDSSETHPCVITHSSKINAV